MKMHELPDEQGHFGRYGGVFVAETLVHALDELRRADEACRKDPDFVAEFEYVLEFGDEVRVLAASLVGASELIERVHQRLGDEHPAIPAEMPLLVRKLMHLHALPLR